MILQHEDHFEPCRELADWARETFIEPGGTLENEDHEHLQHASIGFLWTNVANAKKGRRIVGQAEPGKPMGMGGKWGKARQEYQVTQWFGEVPDFIITLDANYASQCSDAEFCALVEHELYHCAQEKDEFGAPRFNQQTGLPVFGMRGHDIEEFIGVVRRYGAEATHIQELIQAAKEGPTIAPANIAQSCGTCLARAA
ncbi:hypothetical protein FF098_014760 [Parvularcula flava]|uniref:Putative phage metallopeptidase domain-containing protein n=1 Tax=Aquisalinus luteolus TaxID=1566827 RepID=A0ABX0HM90_9PROT|nr:hypothetical protein [Aquisalinus luteolus]